MTIMREEGPIVQPFFMQVATAFNKRVLGIADAPDEVLLLRRTGRGSVNPPNRTGPCDCAGPVAQ
jgi:hypothetical protein